MLSPTSKVDPSGVITLPLGNASPSAAIRAVPSGSTATMHVSTGFSPPYMSKPKLPT